jgi:hypothetical protein
VRRRAFTIRRALRWQPVLTALAIGAWTVLSGLAGAGISIWKFQIERSDAAEVRDKAAAERDKDRDKAAAERDKDRTETDRKNALTRKLEAQRPFLEQKMRWYFEAINVAGHLVDPDLRTDNPIWVNNATRFWQLRWGELEMVGDPGIRNAVRLVGEQIRATEGAPDLDRHYLRWAIECLADELRFSLEHTWGLERGLMRETVLHYSVPKLPDGCNQGQTLPVRPEGMRGAPIDDRSPL